LKRVLRGFLVLVCIALICAVVFVCFALAQEPEPAAPPGTLPPPPPPASYQISGTVKNGKTPLPGATVTAANTLTGKKTSVATAVDGSFTIKGLARGRYVVKVEFMGFATNTQEVVLNPDHPTGTVEQDLILASRQQQEQANRASNLTSAIRGFQSLAVEGALSNLAETGGGANSSGNVSANDLSSLPMNGAGADLSPSPARRAAARNSAWAVKTTCSSASRNFAIACSVTEALSAAFWAANRAPAAQVHRAGKTRMAETGADPRWVVAAR